MKLLVVCQHFYPEQFRINDICFELVKRGHDVTVLTGLPNYPQGKVLKKYRGLRNYQEVIQGVKVERSFLIGRGSSLLMMGINYACFTIMASLKAIVMKKDFDLVYVYQISPITMAVPAILIKKIKKIPLIIHCLDQWPISVTTGPIPKESLFYKILYQLSRSIYRQANLITLSSKSFRKYFEEELKLNRDPFGLVYWPSYAEDNYGDIQSVENDTFDLVFAGNIGPAQSVETIIEAAKLLRDHSAIRFHIVGDGLSRAGCEALAKSYELSNVVFYGYHPVSEMAEYYAIADAFLITMVNNDVVNQTLPAKLQSYMLAGKPILGAINGEVRNAVEEANCGLCCESMDSAGLAELILQAASQPENYRTWCVNARAYYEANFDKEKLLVELEEMMVKLSNNHHR